MKKTSVFIDEIVLQELKKLPGVMAEHIRTAIDDYLKGRHNVSTSPTIVHEDIHETHYTKKEVQREGFSIVEEGDSDEEKE